MGKVLVLDVFSISASSNFLNVLSDWHKSLLGWCKFDSMVDLKLSIKIFDNFIRPHMCDYIQRHQSGLFHYAFGPSF